MNIIIKTLTITAYALLLTAGQTARADSIGEPTTSPATEAFGGPAIRLVVTPGSESAMATVSYTNQNLESEAGAQELYQLLQRASKKVCGGATSQHRRPVIMKSARLRCYRRSLSDAISKIDNENLTRVHTG